MERWKINLYAIWCSQILSLMSFSFGFPFLPFYVQDLGVTEPDQVKFYAGLVSMAPAITMAVMAPIWGMAADRWGKKLMLLRAMLSGAIIITLMGMVTNADQLVVLRFIQGIFTGTVVAAGALVASSTPEHRLSYAMGFLSSSAFIGSSIGPILGGFFAEYSGYRFSFIFGGILMLIDFFLVLFLVKEDGRVQEDSGNERDISTGENGNVEENSSVKVEKRLSGSSMPVHRIPVSTGEKECRVSWLSIFSGSMIIMLFILFILRFSRSIFSPYLPLFVQEIRGELEGAPKITGIINGVTGLMTALSGLTLSRLGDKYSKTWLLKVMFVFSILFAIPLVLNVNLWVFTLLYGAFFFVLGGVEPVVVSLTTEQTPPERRGLLFGIQGLVGNIGWAVSPILGSIVSIKYSLHAVLFLIPISLLPALALVLVSRRKNEGILYRNGDNMTGSKSIVELFSKLK